MRRLVDNVDKDYAMLIRDDPGDPSPVYTQLSVYTEQRCKRDGPGRDPNRTELNRRRATPVPGAGSSTRLHGRYPSLASTPEYHAVETGAAIRSTPGTAWRKAMEEANQRSPYENVYHSPLEASRTAPPSRASPEPLDGVSGGAHLVDWRSMYSNLFRESVSDTIFSDIGQDSSSGIFSSDDHQKIANDIVNEANNEYEAIRNENEALDDRYQYRQLSTFGGTNLTPSLPSYSSRTTTTTTYSPCQRNQQQQQQMLPSYERATRHCPTPPPYCGRSPVGKENTDTEGCYSVRLARRVPTPFEFPVEEAKPQTTPHNTEVEVVERVDLSPATQRKHVARTISPITATLGCVSAFRSPPQPTKTPPGGAGEKSASDDSGCALQTTCYPVVGSSVSPAALRTDQTSFRVYRTPTNAAATGNSAGQPRGACPILDSTSGSDIYVELASRTKARLRSRSDRDARLFAKSPSLRNVREAGRACPSPVNHFRCDSAHSSVPQLPEAVLRHVFRRLSKHDLCRASRVCKQWWTAAWDPSLWRSIHFDGSQLPNSNEYGEVNVDRAVRVILRRLSSQTEPVCLSVESISMSGGAVVSDVALRTMVKRCPELRALDVSGSFEVTNIAVFELVSACSNITDLNLSDCTQVSCIQLTPEATIRANAYGQRSNIRKLDMSGCTRLDDAGVRMIAAFCPQLDTLYMRRCPELSDLGIQYIANYCRELRELSVNDCARLTDTGIAHLAALGDSLRYLSVAKCSLLGDEGIIQMTMHCQRLRYLNLRSCERITDLAVVNGIARHCGHLKSLDIGKCSVGDDSLRSIANGCQRMRKLSLKACRGVTESGVIALSRTLVKLQQLNVQECHLQVDAYKAIKQGCRYCVIEHTNPSFF